MGIGAFAEPFVVVSLLGLGCYINRERRPISTAAVSAGHKRNDSLESGCSSPDSETGLLSPLDRPLHNGSSTTDLQGRHIRTIRLLRWQKEVVTVNTEQFADRWLSRIVVRIPFIIEVMYWALIYWVYQLARAFSAYTLVEGTVDTARRNALQVIHLEQRLGIFWEPAIQRFFLQYPALLHWINRTYSFVHIPATIAYLIWLYYLTITANRSSYSETRERSPAGPALYQARRRTMAMCNLIAFVVFTAWPCMPPRLLSDPSYHGDDAEEAKSFGFVDTVHSAEGESSVWTKNRFCNQYAAMPSLHFGYSLLIGLTIAFLPLTSDSHRRSTTLLGLRIPLLSLRRMGCIMIGFGYPALILTAIVATANHFILDAVAGAMVCGVAWNAQLLMLNLLPLEDMFFWCIRTHKPSVDVQPMLGLEEKLGNRRSSA